MGATGITFAFCLFIPMLGTMHTTLTSINDTPVRIVAMPPETRRELDLTPPTKQGGPSLHAPSVSGAPLSLPTLSLATDIQIPALPGPSSLSLAAPSAPESGITAPAVTTFDKPPRVLTRLDPFYPTEARRSGTEGCDLVRVLVDEDGRAAKTEVVESQPAGVFDAAALKAIRGWRFSPAQRFGHSVAVRIDIPISFKLDR